MDSSLERLQNVLAQRGVASRRGAADIIRAGRVTVDGHPITEPGYRVEAAADIRVDGRTLPKFAEPHHTFLYHKPVGEVCSTDGQGARSVLEAFRSFRLRLVPVGRLDKESEGLLLISNDGALIQQLTHPRYAHHKIYEVEVHIDPTPQQLDLLRQPLVIEGYRIRPVPVKKLAPRLLQFTLSEGRHRQIRQMCDQAGLRVKRLRRVALSGLRLGALPPGRYRELTPAEIAQLLNPKTSR
ncbi:MAG: rRNA pseudouridine synthase [Kiritimatiellae bacterium]|nr:rRNA pseudouridine synthase [Kiritimatiellia bacterium]